MTQTLKVLGQATPGANLTPLYVCPAATQTVVSSITVCNTTATVRTYRFGVAVNSAANTVSHYIAYDKTLAANATDTWVLGITIDASDVVRCYAQDGLVAFSAFGQEIT